MFAFQNLFQLSEKEGGFQNIMFAFHDIQKASTEINGPGFFPALCQRRLLNVVKFYELISLSFHRSALSNRCVHRKIVHVSLDQYVTFI